MGYLRTEKHDDGTVVVHLSDSSGKVNKLSAQMMAEMGKIIEEIENTPETRALIFISDKEDSFLVGADLKELAAISTPGIAEEMLHRVHTLFGRIENLPFPVIAAVHGHCLGGGMELALACHFRIATDDPKTVMGLPEVRLGLLPAAGGTQRLPRLIGVRKAIPLMMEGRTFNARNAKAYGIVDLLTYPSGLEDTARKCIPFFKRKNSRTNSHPKLGSLNWALVNIQPVRKYFFDYARKQTVKKTAGNYPAPMQILNCVERGLAHGFAAGLTAEAAAFDVLLMSPESKALRSLFFATTALKKNPLAEKAVEVKRIGIIGSGFMGSGIAAVSVQAGLSTIIKDISWRNLAGGLKAIWTYLDRRVKRNRGNPVERDRAYSLVTPVTDYSHFSEAEMVIEAVFEDLPLKRNILMEVEEVSRPDCIFSSNTSAIPISSIASASKHPETVVGMHYFSPVTRMPLLEVAVTPSTADWVIATAIAVGQLQGKTVIVVRDGPGFYTSRILAAFLHEALSLLHEGAGIEQVDNAMRVFGFPVGPFKLIDEVGIDVAAHVSEELGPYFSARGLSPPKGLQQLLQAGFRGRKNRRGFYSYDVPWWRKRMPASWQSEFRFPNKEVYTYFGEGDRKETDNFEVTQRLVFAMVNEAVLCLADGIIASPRDGDVGAVLGLGFPPFIGGPFRYLDSTGIAKAVLSLEQLAARFGPRFTPPTMLTDMASRHEQFYAAD